MSVTTFPLPLPVPAPVSIQPSLAVDADFEHRWTAWKAHGASHDRLVRHRLGIAGIALALIALAALAARLLAI